MAHSELVTTPDRPSARVGAALEDRNALWVQALRAKALEREVEAARALLHIRETSRSWNATAPLRRARERVQALWR